MTYIKDYVDDLGDVVHLVGVDVDDAVDVVQLVHVVDVHVVHCVDVGGE
jgi:hypothetical protein